MQTRRQAAIFQKPPNLLDSYTTSHIQAHWKRRFPMHKSHQVRCKPTATATRQVQLPNCPRGLALPSTLKLGCTVQPGWAHIVLLTFTSASDLCLRQNRGVALPSMLKLGCTVQSEWAHIMCLTFTISSDLCSRQNRGLALPSTLKLGRLKHYGWAHKFPRFQTS